MRSAPHHTTAVVTCIILGVTAGAQRRLLSRHTPFTGAAVLSMAVVAGTLRTEAAVDTWAVKHLRLTKGRDVQRDGLELRHGAVWST